MNILITGGAGFIGSHLATLYQGRATIRVLDNLRTGHRHNLAGLAVEFIEGSILDPVVVQRAMLGIDRADDRALGVVQHRRTDGAGQMILLVLGRAARVDEGIEFAQTRHHLRDRQRDRILHA